MSKIFIYISIFCLVVSIFSCRQSVEDSSSITETDSLSGYTEDDAERTKKLIKIKRQIESAKYSKSVLKYSRS